MGILAFVGRAAELSIPLDAKTHLNGCWTVTKMTNTLDQIWRYKNYNMVTELDIAGEFIFQSMRALNQMSNIRDSAMLFSFFYHASVGIERMQKIVLVLFETIDAENHQTFEESLKTHSLIELSGRICSAAGVKMSSRENSFLQMLTHFYRSGRYDRFMLTSNYDSDRELFYDFISQHLPDEKLQFALLSDDLMINDAVRELMGRVIGGLAQKYYALIKKGCAHNNTFSYELRCGSHTEKVFWAKDAKKSLQKEIITEQTALRELLIFLRNCKSDNPLFRYLDAIPPLELDPAMLNDYLYALCCGEISQDLIDEVENAYCEISGQSHTRVEEISAIGSPDAVFNWYDEEGEEEET